MYTLEERALLPFLKRTRRTSWGEVPPLDLTRFFQDTFDLSQRLIPSERLVLLMDDPQRRTREAQAPLTVVAAFGEGSQVLLGKKIVPTGPIFEGAYAQGKPMTSNQDIPVDLAPSHVQSVAAVPIRLEQARCGVFVLLGRQDQPLYTHEDTPLIELLAAYISRAILNAVDILKQNELAQIDELTGLRNLRGLGACLESEITRAKQLGCDVGVIFVDLDKLKTINDLHGHQMGSEALRVVARSLQQAVGNRGAVFRFGGDEYVIVSGSIQNIQETYALAEMCRTLVAKSSEDEMNAGLRPFCLSVSLGVTSLRSLPPQQSLNMPLPDQLLAAADQALYRAKHAGRNCVR